MADRWPAVMRAPTAAEYLDVSPAQFRKVVKDAKIASVQLTERGDLMYLREDLDTYLEHRRQASVESCKAA